MHRRKFISISAGSCALIGATGVLSAPNPEFANPLPNPANFQSGDLLWPKKPGAYVPYKSVKILSNTDSELMYQRQWEAERKNFLSAIPAHSTHLSDSEIDSLRTLTYREFYSLYAGDREYGGVVQFASISGLYVGHMAILDVDERGTAWVIEALLNQGVVKQKYTEWLNSRPNQIVWHGRLRQVEGSVRLGVADEATRHVGKPYEFWNFDLDNDEGFYCSKLAWLSIWRSCGVAIDDNPNPKRSIWLSPKQFLYLRGVMRLNDPGSYADA